MQLSPEAQSAFEQHALQQYPKEACGLIVNGNYLACVNEADDPLADFRIKGVDYLIARGMGDVQAVLHSHPYDSHVRQLYPAQWPSTRDMQSWLNSSIPWGIAATEGECVTSLVWMDEQHPAPLVGRDFIHGINDCYSVIRDAFKEKYNVVLPNFARGWGWWQTDADLYLRNFESAGFHEIQLDHVEVGDVLLMRGPGSRVVSHGALVIGPNQILHHQFGKLSCVQSLTDWHRMIVKAVRYTKGIK